MEESRIIEIVGSYSKRQVNREDCIVCHNARFATVVIDGLCLDCYGKKIVEKQTIIDVLNLGIPSLSPMGMEKLESALGEIITNRHIPLSIESVFKDAVVEELTSHMIEEEYDCPIHGKLGGINECPRC